jgi:WD40 repeat protein
MTPWAGTFSPDGKSLAVGSHEKDGEKVSGRVILWDTAAGKKQVTLPFANGPITAVAFASKNGDLAAASYSPLPRSDIANFCKGTTKVMLRVWEHAKTSVKNDGFPFHSGLFGVSRYKLTTKISKKDHCEIV